MMSRLAAEGSLRVWRMSVSSATFHAWISVEIPLARHQQTTVVLHHPLAVTILTVQGQHNTDTDFTMAHIDIARRYGLLGRRCDGRLLAFWKGNLDRIALFKLVARLIHLRISIQQILNGEPIGTSYAKDSLLTLYLV